MSRFRPKPSPIVTASILFLAALLSPNPASPEGFAAQTTSEPDSHPNGAYGDAETGPATTRRAGPYRRPFVTALGVVPLATYVAAKGSRPSEVVYPGERFAVAQIVGGGYVVNPRFRFGAVGIFNEVFSGLPAGASTWQLGAVAPIAIGTFDHFIFGGGPVLAYRSAGRRQSDLGFVVLTGASIPLRKGLAVNLMAPTTGLFSDRSTVSVGIAAGVAKVF